MTESGVFGVLARYSSASELLAAVKTVRDNGFQHVDAFAPFPVPGLAEALGFEGNKIPQISLFAGVSGAVAAFFMQWYSAVIDYPYVVGGKPLASWPAFLPISFELGVLAAVLAAVVAMLAGNKLPAFYHPAFNSCEFERASEDGFFLIVPCAGSDRDERTKIEQILHTTGADSVQELAS